MTAVQRPASAGLVWLAGQVIVGACVSFTVTVKEQAAVLAGEAPSVACQVTVVTPFGNCEPLAVFAALVRVAVAAPQLSVAVGAV